MTNHTQATVEEVARDWKTIEEQIDGAPTVRLLELLRDYLVMNSRPGNDLAPRYISRIDAILALPSVGCPAGWADMDSAPKDQTIFVRRDNGCGTDYGVVWWNDDGDGYPWKSEYNAYPADRWDEWMLDPAPPQAGEDAL